MPFPLSSILRQRLSYLWLPIMPPLCPRCGYHPFTVRSADEADTTTVTFTAPGPNDVDLRLPKLGSGDNGLW
jgi:hypothetical protein